jgi:hypothetical protein
MTYLFIKIKKYYNNIINMNSTNFGDYPKPQKQKLPKQYREKKLIKPVFDPYGNNQNNHLQFRVKTDIENDKKIKPAKVFDGYKPPKKNSKKST